MIHLKSLVSMLVLVILLTSCASVDPAVSPMIAERPSQEAFRTELKQEMSSLNMIVETTEQELSDLLNRVAPRELYRGATKVTGLTLIILRDGPVQVQAADNFINLAVPVTLTLRYGIFETLPVATRLRFRLSAGVTPDWKVVAEVHYTGLSDQLIDEINIGAIAIKPRNIVEGATQPLQRTLSTLITRRLQEKFPLRLEAEKVWNAAHKPILLDKRYDAWLRLAPQEAYIYPLFAQQRQIRLGVGLKAFTEVVVGPEPAARPVMPLPGLKRAGGTDRTFRVALNTDLFYKELLRVTTPLLLNREFGSDGKRIILKGIELYGNGGRLVIRLETDGSLKGIIYLTCRPVFNPQTNIFSVEDVDFDLQTENMLVKTAEWLLHGSLRSTIQEKLNLDLTQRVLQIQQMAGKALAKVALAENLYLTGTVRTIRLSDVLVQQDKLSIQVYAEGESSILLR